MCARRVFCAHFPNEVVMPSVLQVVELEINSFKWPTQWHRITYAQSIIDVEVTRPSAI